MSGPDGHVDGLRRARGAALLFKAYRVNRLRRLSVRALLRLEGGQFYSATLRRVLDHYHGVRVGAYSYGTCMLPGVFPAGVTVGRYVSVGPGVQVFRRNHPLERLSLHPFFYNHHLGFVETDTIPSKALHVGDDAWIGANAIITPGCSRIGIGAVVGAGAVVTRDVPDFAIVAGNPARVIRLRFSERTCEEIKASAWWMLSPEECLRDLPGITETLATPLHAVTKP